MDRNLAHIVRDVLGVISAGEFEKTLSMWPSVHVPRCTSHGFSAAETISEYA